jgi:hypothetical protein
VWDTSGQAGLPRWAICDDSLDRVYLIVPAGSSERHATLVRPGALIGGSVIAALCNRAIKVPLSTPYPREPKSRHITDRCSKCDAASERYDLPSRNWDF